MFNQVWNKYLPIIKILLKRSANGDQTLEMNRTDFERAAGGRKVKYTFNTVFRKTRMENAPKQPPVVKALAAILMEDDMTRQLFRKQDFEISMNTSFHLMIKNCTPPEAEPEAESLTADMETDSEKTATSEEKNNENSAEQ